MTTQTVGHTPGPWSFEPASKGISKQEPDYIITQTGLPNVAEVWGRNVAISGQSGEANARLIAAAPDLLAACQKLLAELESLHADIYPKCKPDDPTEPQNSHDADICPSREAINTGRAALAHLDA